MLNKWISLLIIFFVSCNSSGVPGGVMPVNTMKAVMWDVIQADEFANLSIAKDSTKNLKQETLKLYSKVFDMHKISNEDFERSYYYYREHPDKEKELLDSLQTYGNKMREANYLRPKLTLPDLPVIRDTTIKN
jgi:Domain of unknown function (DUF4296)